MNIGSQASNDLTNQGRNLAAGILPARLVACAMLLGLPTGLSSAAQAQTIPSAMVTQNTKLVSINGNAGHVATNTAGDAFYVSQTDNVAYWLKHGTTAPIPLVSGLSGGRSVYVDASNNVYVPSNYSGVIIEIPYINNSYTTNSARTSLTACTNATPTAPCLQFGNGGVGVSYYYQATDLGFDGSGNAYVLDEYNNKGANGVNTSNAIEEFVYNGVSYAATVLINNLPQNSNAQLAVDKKGDVFYADPKANTLAMVPAGTTTLIPIGSGFMSPSGVSLDHFGNLFITDSTLNEIFEMPALNGVPQPSLQFVFDPIYSANGVAVDNLDDMYYTGYSGGTNLSVARLNAINIGSAAVGTALSSTPATLTVNFTTAETLGTLTFTGAASGFSYVPGSCTAGTAYKAANTCNFNINYTPTAPGVQTAGVVITNASGATIAIADISGVGLGAGQTTDPGTASAVGSGYSSPMAIAVDGSKNVYIADPGKNAVFEYAAGSTTAVSLGTGLSKPSSVAVDNAGNVFIGDAGNGRVVEVPTVAGVPTSSAQTVILSGLGSTIGVATDVFGDLYIADTNNNKVYQLAPVNGTPTTGVSITIPLPSTSVAPFALATDGTGNLFIADITANTVTEVSYFGRALTNIGTGYLHPSGLATDASGSLYVADPGNVRLIKIPFESPIYNTNDQYSVGPPFSLALGVTVPYAVAVDSGANLYVLDNLDADVTFLNRQQGTLNLGSSNVSATTAQQNSYIADSGNQPLVFGNPDYTAAASPAFSITSPSGDGCANSQTLLPGFSCVLQATFTPPAVASYTETLAFNSNAANTATPQLTLTGLGLKVATTTLALKQTSPAGTAAFGQTVVISATISSTTSGTPSGDIIVYVDGNFYSVVKVTGATVNVNINGLLGGSHTIAASYTGDNTFASSNSTLTITVVKAVTTTSVVVSGVSQFPTSAAAGTIVTFTATVVPNATTVPTGTVTFTAGSTVLGTASVVPTNGVYIAMLKSGALPLGNDTVVASYSGDVNYLASSGSLGILISPQTYTLSPATQTATVSTAGTVNVPLQSSSISGFAAYVSVVCSGLPANTTCGFLPDGFPLQSGNLLTNQQTNPAGTIITVPSTYGPLVFSVNITTGNTPPVPPPTITAMLHNPATSGVPIGLAFLGLAPFTLLLRRRMVKHLRGPMRLFTLLLLLGGGIATFSGCGSNLVGATPPGTYMVTITATATDPNYPAITPSTPAAAGCAATPMGSTSITCVQTAQIALTVTP